MIKCYRDQTGYCRVDPGDVHPLIAAYLEQDVQQDLHFCQELLGVVDEVKGGRRGEWEATGNAHTVTIQPGVVVIRNEWDDSLGECATFARPFSQLRCSMAGMRRLLSQVQSSRCLAEPFPVGSMESNAICREKKDGTQEEHFGSLMTFTSGPNSKVGQFCASLAHRSMPTRAIERTAGLRMRVYSFTTSEAFKVRA